MYKKLLQTLIMVSLVALTFGSLPALAEDDSLSISADVGVFSQYIWRGYTLSDESIVIQPSVTVGYEGFSLNVWGNFDTDYFDTGADYNETDFTLSYDWSYDIIDFGVGYIYYNLEGDDTQEIYFSTSFEGYLKPTIKIYIDTDSYKGLYVNLGFSHSYAVTEQYNLDLSASFGYHELDAAPKGYLNDGNISASMTFPINDKLSMTPYFGYIFALSSRAKDAGLKDYKGNTDHFVGGFTASYSF